MSGEVIKSFLVGLGFGVDDASLGKFNKSIKDATIKITALYASTKLAAAGIVYGISEISEGFEKLGYEYRIIAPAINKALLLRRELLKAYSAAGINITKVVQSAVKLNFSIDKTKFALEAIYKSVGSRFFSLLTKQSDIFRQKIYQNMPKIQNALERFIKFIFKAVEAVTVLGLRLWGILTRVYDFFAALHKATDGWSTVVIGLIAAWRLLNLSFLATPLGMLLTGFVALLALYDDFKTFQEGGKSLFDWTDAAPKILAIIELMKVLLSLVTAIGKTIYDFIRGEGWAVLANDLTKVLSVLNLINVAMDKFARTFSSLNGILDWRDKIDNEIFSFFSNGNVAANLQNNPTNSPLVNPIGANGGGNSATTNQNVRQQTSINIMGGVDALANGNAVAAQQNRVNADMTRNMRNPTR